MIISAFPGCGKTYLFNKINKDYTDLIVSDSDSSKFSWLTPGVRNPSFPANYIEHLNDINFTDTLVFASSHKEVRDELIKTETNFILVYPQKSLKQEYLNRYEQRGSPQSFIDLIDKNWDIWIDELDELTLVQKIILGPNQYLSDAFDVINHYF